MTQMFSDENVKKSNHKNAPGGAFLWFDFGKSRILGSPTPQFKKLRNQITKMRPAAHFCDLILGKAEFSAPPPHPGWATTATTATE